MEQTGMTVETAKSLATILAPFLPYLIKGLKVIGREAAPAAGKAIGDKIPDAVKAIWNRLQPKVKEKPEVQEAVNQAAEKPDDEAAQQNLQDSFASLLDDAKFREEIAGLVAAAEKDESVIQVIQKVGNQKARLTGASFDSGDQLKKTGAKKVVVKQEIEDNTGTTVGFQIGKLDTGRKPSKGKKKPTR